MTIKKKYRLNRWKKGYSKSHIIYWGHRQANKMYIYNSIEFLNKKASKMNLCAEKKNRYKLLRNFMSYIHTHTHNHIHTDRKKVDFVTKITNEKEICLKSTLAACLLRCFLLVLILWNSKCVKCKCSCQSIYKLFII